jgi:hypothetical protein
MISRRSRVSSWPPLLYGAKRVTLRVWLSHRLPPWHAPQVPDPRTSNDASDLNDRSFPLDPVEHGEPSSGQRHTINVRNICSRVGVGERRQQVAGAADIGFDRQCRAQILGRNMCKDFSNIRLGTPRVLDFHGRCRDQNAFISSSGTIFPASKSASPSSTRARSCGVST